jgi:putative DNA primase/helicase
MPKKNGPGRVGDAVEAGGVWTWIVARPNTASTGPAQRASNAVTALDAALGYARGGWPVFPCHWQGKRRKRPLIERGLLAATRDETQIRIWWARWPNALIGIPTGRATRLVVLDIDVKTPRANGFDTLADLGKSILPETPMAHTASGGLHLCFGWPDHLEIRNSVGEKGLGPGLDVRGEGGYFIAPSPGSGYSWDPHWNLETVPLLRAPAWLGHRQNHRREPGYGYPNGRFDTQTALDQACARIRTAPDGQKHDTLNREVFSVATLVAARLLAEADAYRALEAAVAILIRHSDADPQRTWRSFNKAFADGLGAPRRAR